MHERTVFRLFFSLGDRYELSINSWVCGRCPEGGDIRLLRGQWSSRDIIALQDCSVDEFILWIADNHWADLRNCMVELLAAPYVGIRSRVFKKHVAEITNAVRFESFLAYSGAREYSCETAVDLLNLFFAMNAIGG